MLVEDDQCNRQYDTGRPNVMRTDSYVGGKCQYRGGGCQDNVVGNQRDQDNADADYDEQTPVIAENDTDDGCKSLAALEAQIEGEDMPQYAGGTAEKPHGQRHIQQEAEQEHDGGALQNIDQSNQDSQLPS